jgi:hypothetical protein
MCILRDGIRGESFVCSELFVVGQSTMALVVREVVCVVNKVFKKMISWPTSERMQNLMVSLKARCGLPSV